MQLVATSRAKCYKKVINLEHFRGGLEIVRRVAADGHEGVEHVEEDVDEAFDLADGVLVEVEKQVGAELDDELGRRRVRRQIVEVVGVKRATSVGQKEKHFRKLFNLRTADLAFPRGLRLSTFSESAKTKQIKLKALLKKSVAAGIEPGTSGVMDGANPCDGSGPGSIPAAAKIHMKVVFYSRFHTGYEVARRTQL